MKIACDGCGTAVEDALMQILERGREILYLCPECWAAAQESSPDEQA